MSGVSVTDTLVLASSVQWEGSSGSVHALDVASGAVRWTVEELRWPSGTSVVGDTVLIGNGNGTVLALDAATGEELHSWMVGASPQGQPVVADGAIYVALQSREVVALRQPGPAAPKPATLVPDRTIQLDEAHEVETTTDGWTLMAADGLGVVANVDVTSAVALGEAVYVGTMAAPGEGGAEVWKGTDEGFESIARFAGAGSAEVVAFGGALYVLTVEQDGIGIYLAMGDERFALVTGAPTKGADGTLLALDDALVALVEGDEGIEAWRMPAGGTFASATVPDGARTASLADDRFGPQADGLDVGGRRYVGLDGPRGGELWATTSGLTFARVTRGGALLPGARAIEPALAVDGTLYAVVQHPDGVAVFTTADGSTFERVPFDRMPRGTLGEVAAIGQTVVFLAHDPDLRVLDGDQPLELARTRSFDVFVLGSGGFVPLETSLTEDRHDVIGSIAAAGDTMLLVGSNFREGDAVWTSEDGVTWTLAFREDGTTPFTLGAEVAVLDGYAYLFHGDQERGLSIWRLDEPLVGAEADGAIAWIWLAIGLLAMLLLAGGAWWMARGRRGGGGPPEPLLAEEFEDAERISTGMARVK